MSKDAWLHALRSDPSPLFKEQLRERLRTDEPTAGARHDWSRPVACRCRRGRWSSVSSLISVPAVRASVAQFVSLFRVVHFVAVPVESSRLDRLEARAPGHRHAHWRTRARCVQSIRALRSAWARSTEAAAAAGMTLAVPQWLPNEQPRSSKRRVVG